MTDFLSLIGAIPSLISAFSGNTTAPYQKQQQQLASNQGQISAALTGGASNPLYSSIYNQYKDQNRAGLASTISEAQGQNRMNANMGRTPLFSNERGGENIFRSLMQGYQNEGVQADQQTRAALTGASGANLQGLAGYNSITPSTVAANKSQNMGYQNIYDLLKGLGGQSNFTGTGGGQVNTGNSGAGNYSLNNSAYQNPNANIFPIAKSYGMSGVSY